MDKEEHLMTTVHGIPQEISLKHYALYRPSGRLPMKIEVYDSNEGSLSGLGLHSAGPPLKLVTIYFKLEKGAPSAKPESSPASGHVV